MSGEVAGQTLGNHRFALDLLHNHNASLLFVGPGRQKGRWAVHCGGRAAREEAGHSQPDHLFPFLVLEMDAQPRLTDSNPWEGQGVKRPKAKPKRPYEAHELLRLLRAAPASIVGKRYEPAIEDLLRLGLMTGALGWTNLRVAGRGRRSQAAHVWIKRGKTEAAKRIIRCTPQFGRSFSGEPTVPGRRTVPELPPQGSDRKKSWYTSKRFTEFRRRVLIEDSSFCDEYHKGTGRGRGRPLTPRPAYRLTEDIRGVSECLTYMHPTRVGSGGNSERFALARPRLAPGRGVAGPKPVERA